MVGGFLPGKTKVAFALPPNAQATSRFGACQQQRNGEWLFQGKGLCSDLLEVEFIPPR